MASELIIRRCTLRVVRRGGWGWGLAKRDLVDRIIRLAPRLLADWLQDLAGDGAGEVHEPVRLRIRLPAAALRDEASFAAALHQGLAGTALEGLREQLADADAQAAAPARHEVAPPVPHEAEQAGLAAPADLPALLLQWREEAALLRRLALLPEAAARLWLARLSESVPPSAATPPALADLAAECAALRRTLEGHMPQLPGGARRDLAILVELMARHGKALSLPRIGGRAVLPDALAAAPAGPLAIGPTAEAALLRRLPQPAGFDPAVGAAPASASHTASRVARRQRPGRIDLALGSVLPFLVLGVLDRLGWLDMVRASLDAIGLPDRGGMLAAAMADLLVPAHPAAGAAHAQREQTLRCFSGLAALPSPAACTAWNRAGGDGLGGIAAWIADRIAEGHAAERPLLIAAAGEDRLLLFDTDGGYPVALCTQAAELALLLDRMRASVVLVQAAALTGTVAPMLAARDQAWITDAPGGRQAALARLEGFADLRCAAGDLPHGRLANAAQQFRPAQASARALQAALLDPGAGGALGQCAFLSASLGLGLLASSLWPDAPDLGPLLALERLGTLDGTARLVDDALEIRPAIGRRYLDLARADVLRPMGPLPWLDGLRVRFVGP